MTVLQRVHAARREFMTSTSGPTTPHLLLSRALLVQLGNEVFELLKSDYAIRQMELVDEVYGLPVLIVENVEDLCRVVLL